MTAPDVELTLELPGPVELGATLWPLAHGTGDPAMRFGADGAWRATRTPGGAATLNIRSLAADRLSVRAWGPGAGAAADAALELVGGLDDPGALVPRHAVLAEAVRLHPGLRLPRSRRILEALLPAICEQKITGDEARRTYRSIVHLHGERAPGPPGLWLHPAPERLSALPYYAFHATGLERRRAEVLRAAARMAGRLEAAPSAEAARRLLGSIPGIGPWTIAEVLRVAWGDPDAVSVGDYHIPSLVAWALAGERHADDARMLELLEPYIGQRGRVQRLLEVSGVRLPRRGPRMPSRNIAAL